MAGSNRSANGSLPCRFDSAAQPDTAPGMVTVSQPRSGIAVLPAKRSGDHAAGARPDAFKPASSLPVQSIAKRSEPMPLLQGSTTVSVMAVASAASTALPPRASMAMPACVASGCDVATALRAKTGWRRDP